MTSLARKVRFLGASSTNKTAVAKSNPLGMPVAQAITLFPPNSNNRFGIIRVGKEGERTHLYDSKLLIKDSDGNVIAKGAPICKSGFVTPNERQTNKDVNPKVSPQLYKSDSKFIDCYRCIRLLSLGKWGA